MNHRPFLQVVSNQPVGIGRHKKRIPLAKQSVHIALFQPRQTSNVSCLPVDSADTESRTEEYRVVNTDNRIGRSVNQRSSSEEIGRISDRAARLRVDVIKTRTRTQPQPVADKKQFVTMFRNASERNALQKSVFSIQSYDSASGRCKSPDISLPIFLKSLHPGVVKSLPVGQLAPLADEIIP